MRPGNKGGTMLVFPSGKELLIHWLKCVRDVMLAVACIALVAWAAGKGIDKTIKQETLQRKENPIYIEP